MRPYPPPHRPAVARRAARAVLALSLPAVLAACGGASDVAGPDASQPGAGQSGASQTGSALSSDVVGAWVAGTVSSVNFYNPSNGSWSAPSGNGLYYRFAADGRYEKGVLIQSSLYGCTMTVTFYEAGTVRVADGAMRLTPTGAGHMKSVDNCSAKENYEKTYAPDAETLWAQRGRDEYGNDVLWLRSATSTPTAFRPVR